MKKNKAYIAIVLLIAVLIFSVAVVCGWCRATDTYESVTNTTKNTDTNKQTANNNTKTNEAASNKENTAKQDSYFIHGVVPTEVKAHGTATSNTGVWDFNAGFWNVGKLGGKQYEKATIVEVCTKPAEGSGVEQNTTIIFNGYFTGGPNGDMYLTYTWTAQLRSDSPETTTYSSDLHCKVKDGKNIVFDEGSNSITIDNPEAFNGWVD
jgi:hypothetical protein